MAENEADSGGKDDGESMAKWDAVPVNGKSLLEEVS
jgi:hypothetical protein